LLITVTRRLTDETNGVALGCMLTHVYILPYIIISCPILSFIFHCNVCGVTSAHGLTPLKHEHRNVALICVGLQHPFSGKTPRRSQSNEMSTFYRVHSVGYYASLHSQIVLKHIGLLIIIVFVFLT